MVDMYEGRNHHVLCLDDNFRIKTHVVWSGQTVFSMGIGRKIDLKQIFLLCVSLSTTVL